MLLNGRTYRIAKASKLRTLTFRKAAANASKLGADPSKGFIVGGISVGGNLASVVSHLAKNKKLSPPLIGIWLDEPNLVTRVWCLRSGGRISRAGSSAKTRPYWTRLIWSGISLCFCWVIFRFGEKVLIMYKSIQAGSPSPLFSPLILPSGHKDLPPHFFLLQGTDPLRDEGLIYERRLRENCGVKTKLVVIPGVPHGFHPFLSTYSKSGNVVKTMFEGIGWLLE
jgi:acetyl esterase/lipase